MFTNDWAEEQKNEKVSKLHSLSQKRSPKRLIVLVKSKSKGHDKEKFPALRA